MCPMVAFRLLCSFFFHDTAPAEIYTLSLHDALPISLAGKLAHEIRTPLTIVRSSLDNLESEQVPPSARAYLDRKSTRLNSSHTVISYAVFCLKKKKTNTAVRSLASTRAPKPSHQNLR